MEKMEQLLNQWDFNLDKEDWYPPLGEVLKGVTEEQADWKPAGAAANTIRETVRHLLFYKERLLYRLTGEETEYPSGITNEDTFFKDHGGELSWGELAEKLFAVHRKLRDELAKLMEADYEKPLGSGQVGSWATSLVLHDAYHTGQIVLLRKLQGSWPARR
ncbi:DinB family protein [Gorillibacterium massiliense]|uniref:DinB family protein n=1 Tax=Gorillibacterium massiliense TaxID=1280390 RepID=UPI0004B9AB32|nr:DinB family protein [Gorillibacterium massiliense]